jgi:hypothetical protein
MAYVRWRFSLRTLVCLVVALGIATGCAVRFYNYRMAQQIVKHWKIDKTVLLGPLNLAGGLGEYAESSRDVLFLKRLDDLGVAVLIEALKDDDLQVKRNAILALQCFGPKAKDAIPSLILLLEEPLLRSNTVLCIGRIGHDAKGAVPKLERMLDPTITILDYNGNKLDSADKEYLSRLIRATLENIRAK